MANNAEIPVGTSSVSNPETTGIEGSGKPSFLDALFKKSAKIWLFTILGLMLIGASLTTDKQSHKLRFSDTNFELSEGWRSITLPRYSEGQAKFTSQENKSFSLDLSKARSISSVSVRYFGYPGDPSILTISSGNVSKRIDLTEKGLANGTVHFDPPLETSKLKGAVTKLGGTTVLIDHLSIETSDGTGFGRILIMAGLFGLFGLSLWLASIVVTPPQSSSGRIYVSVDVLRGVGVLLVILLHATGYAGLPDLSAREFLSATADAGHFGVEIFYVVSAYTLTYSLASAIRKKRSHKIGSFWNRRFNRIVPTLFVCLVLAFVFRGVLASGLTVENLLPMIGKFLSMGYVFDREVLITPIGHTVWWSISTEFQFYVLMPMLFLPIMAYLGQPDRRRSTQILVAVAIIIFGIILSAFAREILVSKPWAGYTVFYHFDAFAIGVGTAILMTKSTPKITDNKGLTEEALVSGENDQANELTKPSLMSRFWIKTAAPLLIFTALILCVAASGIVDTALPLPKAFYSGRLFIIIICALVIFGSRWLEERDANFSPLHWLRTLGLLSFIVYLLHIPMMQIVTKLPVPELIATNVDYYFWILMLSSASSIVAALVLHIFVERPALRLNGLAERIPLFRTFTTVYVLIVIVSLAIGLGLN